MADAHPPGPQGGVDQLEAAGSMHGFGYVVWRGRISGRWLAEITPPSGQKTILGLGAAGTFSDAMRSVCAEIAQQRGVGFDA